MSTYLLSAAEGGYLLHPNETSAYFAALTFGELVMLDVVAIRRKMVKKHKRDPRPVEQTFVLKGREWDHFHPCPHHEVFLRKIRRDGAENILSIPRRLRAELGDGVHKFIGRYLLNDMRAQGLVRKFRVPIFSNLTPAGKEMKARLQEALSQVDALPPPDSQVEAPGFPLLLKNLGALLLLHGQMSFDRLGRLGESCAEMSLAEIALQGQLETGKSSGEMLYDWNGIQLLPAWKYSRFLDVFMQRMMKSLEIVEESSGGVGALDWVDLLDF